MTQYMCQLSPSIRVKPDRSLPFAHDVTNSTSQSPFNPSSLTRKKTCSSGVRSLKILFSPIDIDIYDPHIYSPTNTSIYCIYLLFSFQNVQIHLIVRKKIMIIKMMMMENSLILIPSRSKPYSKRQSSFSSFSSF